MGAVSWGDMLAIAVGLSVDAFAVSLAVGLTIREMTLECPARLAICFAVAQVATVLIGWGLGRSFAHALAPIGVWIAFVVLTGIGLKMLLSGARDPLGETSGDPTRGLTLIVLSAATSLDGIAVGVPLAAMGVAIGRGLTLIAATVAVASALGCTLGRHAGRALGRGAEIAGGVALCGIGIKLIVAHLWG